MAIQLKMRYRYTSAGAWNYPPSTLRGIPSTDATSIYNVYALPSTLGNTMPALAIPMVRVSGNEVVTLVGSRKIEKDGGFGLELNPKFILQRIGLSGDELIYDFLRYYDAAPLKQIGYRDGFTERLSDGTTHLLDVVTKQVIDIGDKDKGNRIGVTLHLELANYEASNSANG